MCMRVCVCVVVIFFFFIIMVQTSDASATDFDLVVVQSVKCRFDEVIRSSIALINGSSRY